MNLFVIILTLISMNILNTKEIDNVEIYFINFNLMFRNTINEKDIPNLSVSNKLYYKNINDINKIKEIINNIIRTENEIKVESFEVRVLVNFYNNEQKKDFISISKFFTSLKFNDRYYKITENQRKLLEKYIPDCIY